MFEDGAEARGVVSHKDPHRTAPHRANELVCGYEWYS